MMHIRNEIENPFCLHCKRKIVEKSPHILLCSHEKSKSFYLEKINNDLCKEMETITTCPTLTATILDILTKWRHGERIFLKNYDYKFHPVIREQKKIGWNNFVIGRWSKKMAASSTTTLFQYQQQKITLKMDQSNHKTIYDTQLLCLGL